MVEVFKTNVGHHKQANSLLQLLQDNFPGSRINFDLDDCDKVLRIEGEHICSVRVMEVVAGKGFKCAILE